MRIPTLNNKKWVVDSIDTTAIFKNIDECYYTWDTLTKELQYRLSLTRYDTDIPNDIYRKYDQIQYLISEITRFRSHNFTSIMYKLNVLSCLITNDFLPFDCKKFKTPLIESVKEDVSRLTTFQ